MSDDKLVVQNLNAWYGKTHAVQDISLSFPDKQATAIIGPSGCGKSTFIRCLNRIHETQPKARSEGKVLLDGDDVYQADPTEDPAEDRDGVPAAERLPDDVDLRQRRGGAQAPRGLLAATRSTPSSSRA